MASNIIPRTTVAEICGHRDMALATMKRAIALMVEGHELAKQAASHARNAHASAIFTLNDRSKDDAYRRLFKSIDSDKSLAAFREQLDARTWMHLVDMTGMRSLMDRTAKDQLIADLCGAVPEVSEETIYQVLRSFAEDAQLIFQRGLARAFIDLDKRFRSHDGFKIGSRIILTNVFDAWGHWNYHSRMRDTIQDIERVFAVLDGQKPDPGALTRAIQADRQGGFKPHRSVTETPYFRIRCFKNGNAHIWFVRDDLVQKANEVLAEYYGAVLPDAVDDDVTETDLRSQSGALCKDLQFYATPQAVYREATRQTHIGPDSYVLEPSAGEGGMALEMLKAGAKVDAVEVSGERANKLRAMARNHPKLSVQQQNFLRMPARPVYSHVIMNPPFYGTHWMQHVMHAWEFLKPGGTLIAILPATAEIGETRKHKAFRKWMKDKSTWRACFYDLPLESFASSGTRVSTVYITLCKPRR